MRLEAQAAALEVEEGRAALLLALPLRGRGFRGRRGRTGRGACGVACVWYFSPGGGLFRLLRGSSS